MTVQVQCHSCNKTAEVRWMPDEQRYRYNRHFIGTGRHTRVRCPASGEPVPAPPGVVVAPRTEL